MKRFIAAITQRGPIGWLRRLNSVVSTYHNNMAVIGSSVDELRTLVEETGHYVKKATKVHVDMSINAKDASTVIVCGVYRGKDYVRAFPVSHSSVHELVDWLTNMAKYAQIGRIDTPPQFDATVKRELKKRGAL